MFFDIFQFRNLNSMLRLAFQAIYAIYVLFGGWNIAQAKINSTLYNFIYIIRNASCF